MLAYMALVCQKTSEAPLYSVMMHASVCT